MNQANRFPVQVFFSNMKSATFVTVIFGCLLTYSFCAQANSQTPEHDEKKSSTVRVMSFNIRLGVAKDGDNHWDKRRELVVATIDNFSPDVLGTQETWDFQAEYLAENLDGYQYVGRSRQLNGNEGEQCGIFFRTERFEKSRKGISG